MATIKQISANRKNSKRSTGPKTKKGKDKSKMNSTKHGLYSQLDNEITMEFQRKFEREFKATSLSRKLMCELLAETVMKLAACKASTKMLTLKAMAREEVMGAFTLEGRLDIERVKFIQTEFEPMLVNRYLRIVSALKT